MNEMTPLPPQLPSHPPQIPPMSQVPQVATATLTVALGDNPADREPITNPFSAIEAILRHPRRVMYQLRQPAAGQLIGGMLLVAVVCSFIYGVVVGSFSQGAQLWAAPVKIAGGLMFTGLLCLPSLYIFACLSGSQARLAEILGLVAGLLMLMTLLLIGFAPVAWLFSQSSESLVWMGTLHLIFWAIATFFGLRFLEAGFSQSQARSRAGLNTWVVIFVLVALQMTTALRPIVGKADTFLPTQKKFFISHWGDCIDTPATAAK